MRKKKRPTRAQTQKANQESLKTISAIKAAKPLIMAGPRLSWIEKIEIEAFGYCGELRPKGI